ncbi:MAG TPA: aminotransferase class I/II-fold pyridoxal phosphate-dependent enzyme, partial [Leptospiraceae bacterium]|nr:aminotransferase class I/II-fold pyridoxal phosphate-dependent enzyme [Leptospiraceae bacterium]
MSSLQNYIQKELEEIKNKNRYRFLKIPNGIDLSSNDYLCLSKNPKLISAFKEGIDLYGTGSTASRLIRGHRDIHEVVEEKFANWVKSET